MNSKKYLFLWVLVAFTFSSCKTLKLGKSGKMKKRSAAFVMNNVGKHNFEADWFSAKAKVKFKGDSQKLPAFDVDIRMKKDSVIWLSASPAIGIKLEVARAVITPDGVQALDRFNKKYYNKDFSFLQQFIDYPLDFQTLQDLIYGQVWNDMEFKKAQVLDTQYCLESEDCKLFVDGEDFSVKQMVLEDVDYNRSLIANFEEYEDIEGKYFSKKRNYLMKAEEKYLIDLQFSKLKVEEVLKFPFKVTSRYEEVK